MALLFFIVNWQISNYFWAQTHSKWRSSSIPSPSVLVVFYLWKIFKPPAIVRYGCSYTLEGVHGWLIPRGRTSRAIRLRIHSPTEDIICCHIAQCKSSHPSGASFPPAATLSYPWEGVKGSSTLCTLSQIFSSAGSISSAVKQHVASRVWRTNVSVWSGARITFSLTYVQSYYAVNWTWDNY